MLRWFHFIWPLVKYKVSGAIELLLEIPPPQKKKKIEGKRKIFVKIAKSLQNFVIHVLLLFHK